MKVNNTPTMSVLLSGKYKIQVTTHYMSLYVWKTRLWNYEVEWTSKLEIRKTAFPLADSTKAMFWPSLLHDLKKKGIIIVLGFQKST